MSSALSAAGVGESVYAFADKSDVGRVVGACGLGGVLRPSEEAVFQLGHGASRFLDEGHELVVAALGPDFFGQREQAEIVHLLYSAIGEFRAGRKRAHNHEAALQVLHTVWVVCAYAATGEEVDDAFL